VSVSLHSSTPLFTPHLFQQSSPKGKRQSRSFIETDSDPHTCSQKLRRSRAAVEPLLEEALRELQYLQEVDLSLQELGSFDGEADLRVLEEVRVLERPPETRQSLHSRSFGLGLIRLASRKALSGCSRRGGTRRCFRPGVGLQLFGEVGLEQDVTRISQELGSFGFVEAEATDCASPHVFDRLPLWLAHCVLCIRAALSLIRPKQMQT
jgi:hypothetical protein